MKPRRKTGKLGFVGAFDIKTGITGAPRSTKARRSASISWRCHGPRPLGPMKTAALRIRSSDRSKLRLPRQTRPQLPLVEPRTKAIALLKHATNGLDLVLVLGVVAQEDIELPRDGLSTHDRSVDIFYSFRIRRSVHLVHDAVAHCSVEFAEPGQRHPTFADRADSVPVAPFPSCTHLILTEAHTAVIAVAEELLHAKYRTRHRSPVQMSFDVVVERSSHLVAGLRAEVEPEFSCTFVAAEHEAADLAPRTCKLNCRPPHLDDREPTAARQSNDQRCVGMSYGSREPVDDPDPREARAPPANRVLAPKGRRAAARTRCAHATRSPDAATLRPSRW